MKQFEIVYVTYRMKIKNWRDGRLAIAFSLAYVNSNMWFCRREYVFSFFFYILATSAYVVALACNKAAPTLFNSGYTINVIHNNNPCCLHTIYWTDDFMRAVFMRPDRVKSEWNSSNRFLANFRFFNARLMSFYPTSGIV